MSLEPNENLRLRSDYPGCSKPIGDAVAQALQDYASAHRLTMENISLRQQLAEKSAEAMRFETMFCSVNDDLSKLEVQLAEAQQEIAHWKNNHATEVRRARILKERTDMPIERVQAYERWCLDLAENAAMRKQLAEKDSEIERLNRTLRQQAEAVAATINRHHEQLADAESDTDTLAQHNIELQQQLAAANAEIERLKAENEQLCAGICDLKPEVTLAEIAKWMDIAGASQLREQQLRNILQDIIRSAELNQAAINTFLLIDARASLALPTDTSALDQIKAKYEVQIQQLLEAIVLIEPSMNFSGWESADGEPIGHLINAAIAAATAQDHYAISAIVTKAGEVMRRRAATNTENTDWLFANASDPKAARYNVSYQARAFASKEHPRPARRDV